MIMFRYVIPYHTIPEPIHINRTYNKLAFTMESKGKSIFHTTVRLHVKSLPDIP